MAESIFLSLPGAITPYKTKQGIMNVSREGISDIVPTIDTCNFIYREK
nr:hypothetical protein [uncultured Clostridium sp.]